MSVTSKFKFNIPIAITIVLVAFFLLFRTPIANLISSGDCLELAFFEATINTCKEKELQKTLAAEQDSIISLVNNLKTAMENLESANTALTKELNKLKRELANSSEISVSQKNAIVSKIDTGIAVSSRILSSKLFNRGTQTRKIEKYSKNK